MIKSNISNFITAFNDKSKILQKGLELFISEPNKDECNRIINEIQEIKTLLSNFENTFFSRMFGINLSIIHSQYSWLIFSNHYNQLFYENDDDKYYIEPVCCSNEENITLLIHVITYWEVTFFPIDLIENLLNNIEQLKISLEKYTNINLTKLRLFIEIDEYLLGNSTYTFSAVILKIIQYGFFDLFQWFFYQYKDIILNSIEQTDSFYSDTKRGFYKKRYSSDTKITNTDNATTVTKNVKNEIIINLCTFSAKYNQFDILLFLYSQGYKDQYETTSIIANYGRHDILQILRSSYNYKFNDLTISGSISYYEKTGDDKILKWLFSNDIIEDLLELFNVETIAELNNCSFFQQFKIRICCTASKYCQIEILEWISKQFKLYNTDQYFISNNIKFNIFQMISFIAIENENIDIIKWVLYNNSMNHFITFNDFKIVAKHYRKFKIINIIQNELNVIKKRDESINAKNKLFIDNIDKFFQRSNNKLCDNSFIESNTTENLNQDLEIDQCKESVNNNLNIFYEKSKFIYKESIGYLWIKYRNEIKLNL